MKKTLLTLTGLLTLIVVAVLLINNQSDVDPEIEELKAKHAEALKNSPFKNNKDLSKDQRKEMGLPPNAYFEQLYELSLDPNTGRPPFCRLHLQQPASDSVSQK